MLGVCLTCGTRAEVEAHHVAGRHNSLTITIPVCTDCHQVLSNWQLASGVELREEAARTELDATRALLVGAVQLIQLYGQRNHGAWLPPDLAAITARAMSKILDGTGDLARSGRWLPDPTVLIAEATPSAFDPATELARIEEMSALVCQLAETFGGLPLMTVRRLREVASQPADFATAFHTIAADNIARDTLAILIQAFNDRADHTARLLLALPRDEPPDQELLEAGIGCLIAGHALLDDVFALAERARQRQQSRRAHG